VVQSALGWRTTVRAVESSGGYLSVQFSSSNALLILRDKVKNSVEPGEPNGTHPESAAGPTVAMRSFVRFLRGVLIHHLVEADVLLSIT
jgi:hypothetical protein